MTQFTRTALSIGLLGFTCTAFAAPDLDSLEKRVEELEKRQQESFLQMTEGDAQVRPFLGNKILFGGYLETGIFHVNGPDTPEQTSAASHTIGLNITAEATESDRLVMQLQTGLGYTFSNGHNDPRGTPKKRQFTSAAAPTILTQAYYEHKFDAKFNVQAGLGYSPYGHAYQLREPVLFKWRGGPQMLDSGSSASLGIAFPLWMGVHMHGMFSLDENRLGYNLYTITNSTNPKNLGVGSRLWFRFMDNATIGVSTQVGDQAAGTFHSYGADADFKFGASGITLEAARNNFSRGQEALKSYYVSPYVGFYKGKILVFGVADYIDNSQNRTGALVDPIDKWEIGGGLNWLPHPNYRFRLTYIDHQYYGDNAVISDQDRNCYVIDLSLAAAF